MIDIGFWETVILAAYIWQEGYDWLNGLRANWNYADWIKGLAVT